MCSRVQNGQIGQKPLTKACLSSAMLSQQVLSPPLLLSTDAAACQQDSVLRSGYTGTTLLLKQTSDKPVKLRSFNFPSADVINPTNGSEVPYSCFGCDLCRCDVRNEAGSDSEPGPARLSCCSAGTWHQNNTASISNMAQILTYTVLGIGPYKLHQLHTSAGKVSPLLASAA
jgi:hypothetical protein